MNEEIIKLPIIRPEQITLKKVKNMVFGLQGSGKTYCSKFLCDMQEDAIILVYSPHRRDFENESDKFYYFEFTDFREDYDSFLQTAINLGKQGYEVICLIDEYDMLTKSGKTLSNTSIDFIANHRHYNCGALFLARRPQDIDALVVESCEYLIGYSIFGDNVKMKLNRIMKPFGDLVQSLRKEERNAVVLQIGHPLRRMEKLRK